MKSFRTGGKEGAGEASYAPALLAERSLRSHRKAWGAVFAALALTSVLIGTFALTLVSTAVGHARVERYAAAPLVVTGDQTTRFTAEPWGSEPKTAKASLTERVGVPERAVDVVGEVPGVRRAVPDVVFPVAVAGKSGAQGRPWAAAGLAPYTIKEGRAPSKDTEVVTAGPAASPGTRLTVTAPDGTPKTYTVVGTADGPDAVYFTTPEARALAGRPAASVDAIGILPERGVSTGELHARVQDALNRAGLEDIGAGNRAQDDTGDLKVLTGNARGTAEHLNAPPARTGLLEMLGSVSATLVMVAVLVVSSLIAQALQQRSGELALLRAVGATPRQVRAAVGREVTRVAVRPALLGAAASVPAFLGLLALLRARDVLPEGLELPTPVWLFTLPLATAALTVGVARLTAAIA
ncbi:ABC transporter permease, partial [Streptomyces sp. T-3]|nr:ABC transporter permease [Streptomyces sp. T-3]